MVKTRVTGDTQEFKAYFDEMIDRFGSTWTLYRDSVEMDSMGCIISATTSSSNTVYGDFQRITDTEELQKYGLTGTGNARFYAKNSPDIQPEDIIIVNSDRWQFKSRVEDDDFGASEVGEVWTLVRVDG